MRGLQPRSVYVWDTLFWVRGRSNNPIDYKIDLFNGAGDPFVDGKIKISVYTDYDHGWMVTHVDENSNTDDWWDTDTDPYLNKPITVKIEILQGADLSHLRNLRLVVTAQAK
jgi:hypothetical protein